MQKEEFISILEKIANGNATAEEIALYLKWYNAFAESEDLWADLKDEPEAFRNELLSKIRTRVFDDIQPARRITLWPKIAAVAAAVTAIALCVYFFNANRHTAAPAERTLAKQDIAPGRNGATIMLGNGKVIQLSGAKTGVVIGEGLKYSDGSDVRYSSGSQFSGSLKGSQKSTGPVGVSSLATAELQGADGKVQNLTASTSKGQTYQFVLPDGTKVWLNADSKISFPSQFNGKERKILLSGEAYFAVKHDARQPFRVESKGQVVEDIGTEFNINAYADESSTRTTLVAGSAKVGAAGRQAILTPNQQATLSNNNIKVQTIDVDNAVAWKEGLFIFEDEPLQDIMQKIARWYDVEVVYSGVDKNERFGGSVSRYDNVSRVLRRLELTGHVHFKIEGRRITAMQ